MSTIQKYPRVIAEMFAKINVWVAKNPSNLQEQSSIDRYLPAFEKFLIASGFPVEEVRSAFLKAIRSTSARHLGVPAQRQTIMQNAEINYLDGFSDSQNSDVALNKIKELISLEIDKGLDCNDLQNVCRMATSSGGRQRIQEAMLSLVLDQGIYDLSAALQALESQFEESK